MRAPLLLSALALLVGCGPKRGGPVKLDAPAEAAVVSLLAPFDGDAVVPVPDGVSARLADLLSQRNLTADPVDVAAAAAALSRGQTTPQRLSWAVEQADGADFVLLVEATAVYNTQIEGRFRWMVEVTSTIARADDPAGAATKTFQVPVFLQFVHEKEAAALSAAGVVIERQVGRQLDQWLSGQQG